MGIYNSPMRLFRRSSRRHRDYGDKRLRPLLLALAVCLMPFLSGCASSDESALKSALTPLPAVPIDPSDKILKRDLQAFLEQTGAPTASSYDLARFDLNADGRREALVLFKTPYGYWCDMHGCTMLVFKAYDDHFTLVNAIQPLREPLYIDDLETKGWKNMAVRVSGRWDDAKDVVLQFDGRTYPSNPADLPPYPRNMRTASVRLFHD